MQVIDDVRRCVAFVGVPTTSGFAVLGTGFFVVVEDDNFHFSYLITAAHVVWPDRRNRGGSSAPPDRPLHIRMNEKHGTAITEKAPPQDWIFHEDKTVDVCALPLGFHYLSEDEQGAFNPTFIDIVDMSQPREQPDKFGVTLGDEIFIPSAFVGRVGENKNIPVIRIGNIAAMPEEPIANASPRKVAYLVETRSLGGVSGAPVFANLQAWRSTTPPKSMKGTRGSSPRTPDTPSHEQRTMFPYSLLGMILGAHAGQYADDFISDTDTDIQVPKDADFNAGISVVLPAWDVVDFLESDPVKSKRTNEIERRNKQSGFKPSSAKRQPRLSVDEGNPTHLEDFTRLLGAAATTKPQADQT